MTKPGNQDLQTTTTLMTALAASAGDGVPDWVQLIPGGRFAGIDGRGPYHVASAKAVIAASMARGQGKLPIDENHATQRAAKEGLAAPARGWIVELADREKDGIWGRVEWTEAGRALVADGAYRGISPVFEHTAGGGVVRILSAALTNDPNLTQLATLHDSEDGLAPDDYAVPGKQRLPIKDATHTRLAWDMVDRTEGLSSEERAIARRRILARARELGIDTSGWEKPAAHTHTQTEGEMDLTELRRVLGADTATDEAGVIAAAVAAIANRAEHTRAAEAATTELRTQIATLTTQIAEMSASSRQARAETYIDAAIRDGKPVRAVREQLVAQHMADPEGTEKLVGGMVSLHAGGAVAGIQVMDAEDGDPLTEEEMATAKAMGIDPREKARAKRLRRLGRADEIGKKKGS